MWAVLISQSSYINVNNYSKHASMLIHGDYESIYVLKHQHLGINHAVQECLWASRVVWQSKDAQVMVGSGQSVKVLMVVVTLRFCYICWYYNKL